MKIRTDWCVQEFLKGNGLKNYVDKISMINTKTNTKWKSDINLAVFSQGDSIFQYISITKGFQHSPCMADFGSNNHYSLWVRQTL